MLLAPGLYGQTLDNAAQGWATITCYKPTQNSSAELHSRHFMQSDSIWLHFWGRQGDKGIIH